MKKEVFKIEFNIDGKKIAKGIVKYLDKFDEELTPLEKLEEYISEKYDMEFLNDEMIGNVNTIEQEIENSKRALQEFELKDCWEDIKSNIVELEKYKDRGLFCKYAVHEDSCLWGQAYIIFDVNYVYINMVRVI